MKYAGFWKRVLAKLIDLVIFLPFIIINTYIFRQNNKGIFLAISLSITILLSLRKLNISKVSTALFIKRRCGIFYAAWAQYSGNMSNRELLERRNLPFDNRILRYEVFKMYSSLS
jgi:hypothetical protein